MLSTNPIVQVNVTTTTPDPGRYRFDVGLILGSSSIITAEERVKGYESLSAMVTAGFTDAMPEHAAAAMYFAQIPAPNKVIVGRINAEETPVQALTACIAKSAEFYPVYACDATSEEIAALATYAKTSGIVLVYGNSDTLETAIGAGGIFQTVKNPDNDRAIGIWHGDDHAGAALMGLACGMANKYREQAWALCYKRLLGISPTADLTQPQVASLKNVNANVFVTRGPKNLFENGAVASGKRYDEVLAIDRIVSDLQQACYDLITNTDTKLPQEDSTTTLFINVCSGVLSQYFDMGILGPGIWRGEQYRTLEPGTAIPDGYVIMADSYASQSNADRLGKKAVPMYMVVHLSGAVECVVIDMAVQL